MSSFDRTKMAYRRDFWTFYARLNAPRLPDDQERREKLSI
jgi:hypothetical protein